MRIDIDEERKKKAERIRRAQGDKSITETVNALIDEADARVSEALAIVNRGSKS